MSFIFRVMSLEGFMRGDVRVLGNGKARAIRVVGEVDSSGVKGGRGVDGPGVVDERPRSVYEVVTRQMLDELKREVSEVKGRVNTLLWMVAGAIVVELVVKVAG